MKLFAAVLLIALALTGCNEVPGTPAPDGAVHELEHQHLVLPDVRLDGDTSVESALFERRSVRAYTGESLYLNEVAQLLWAAQGVTAGWGGRTAPSAGALYPLELYLVAGDVEGLDAGVYRYVPGDHRLEMILSGDVRTELSTVSLGQSSVSDGAAVFVFSGVYERTRSRYGDRAERYVHMEVGHAAQNLCLQAVALDLGSVVVGAFNDGDLKALLMMPEREAPLYVVPVGRVDSGS